MATHTSPNPIHWFGRKYDRRNHTFRDLSDDESYSILKGILTNGFRFSKCKERMPISPETAIKLQISAEEFGTGSDMICFTDIPPDKSEFHRSKYGSWGIEMKRSWLVANGGQPVIYRSAHHTDHLMHRMLLLWTVLNPGSDPGLIEARDALEEHTNAYQLPSLLRQITSDFFFSAKHIDHEVFTMNMGNFLEREWRIVQQPGQLLHAKFNPSDVATIFYSGGNPIYDRILADAEIKAVFSTTGLPVLSESLSVPPPALKRRHAIR